MSPGSHARADGSFNAVPAVSGRVKTFQSRRARRAVGALIDGLTVMAKTYNGVVPGPVIEVNQGDTVVINYTNTLAGPRYDSSARHS